MASLRSASLERADAIASKAADEGQVAPDAILGVGVCAERGDGGREDGQWEGCHAVVYNVSCGLCDVRRQAHGNNGEEVGKSAKGAVQSVQST